MLSIVFGFIFVAAIGFFATNYYKVLQERRFRDSLKGRFEDHSSWDEH